MGRLCYIPLTEFIDGIYEDLFRAQLHAQGLQREYLVALAADQDPDFPATEVAGWLEVGSLSMDVYFANVFQARPSVFKRIGYALGFARRPPDGIYLHLTTKDQAEFSVTINSEKPRSTVGPQEPEGNSKANFYVVTKAC